MIELTAEQQLALSAERQPARVLDPRTKETYVLVPADVYDRITGSLPGDQDIDPRDAYPLVDEVFAEDWDDPKMAEYDRYEEHKR